MPVKKFAAMLNDPSHFFWVAEIGGVIGGYALLAPSTLEYANKAPGAYDFSKLYVLPEYQHHGLGSALANALLTEADQRRIPEIYISVWENNPGAQRLYARLGFERVGEVWFILGPHRDFEWLLRRTLSASAR